MYVPAGEISVQSLSQTGECDNEDVIVPYFRAHAIGPDDDMYTTIETLLQAGDTM